MEASSRRPSVVSLADSDGLRVETAAWSKVLSSDVREECDERDIEGDRGIRMVLGTMTGGGVKCY